MKLFGKRQNENPAERKPIAFGSETSPANPASGANGEPTPPAGPTRKVLVVDDNPVILKSFDLKLKGAGFEVITATDGAGAVRCARQQQPEVIVLDISFPPEVGSTGLQWDGFNIMDWMRRFKEVADIPVMIITAGESPKLKERALAAGAVAFFQKPIDHDEFLAAMLKVLKEPHAVS